MMGRAQGTCYWIASRFRALTLAMTVAWQADGTNGRGKRTCYWIASLALAMTDVVMTKVANRCGKRAW